MLVSHQCVEAIVVAENMVPAAHRLVIAILADIRLREEILIQALARLPFGAGYISRNLLPDRADAAGRNGIPGERIADVDAVRDPGRNRAAARFGGGVAAMRRQSGRRS